jgi:hypothetical protein
MVKVTVKVFDSPGEVHFYPHQIDEQVSERTAELQEKKWQKPVISSA